MLGLQLILEIMSMHSKERHARTHTHAHYLELHHGANLCRERGGVGQAVGDVNVRERRQSAQHRGEL